MASVLGVFLGLFRSKTRRKPSGRGNPRRGYASAFRSGAESAGRLAARDTKIRLGSNRL